MMGRSWLKTKLGCQVGIIFLQPGNFLPVTRSKGRDNESAVNYWMGLNTNKNATSIESFTQN
jgi:hypothetical protein